jgi:hypothetical protein
MREETVYSRRVGSRKLPAEILHKSGKESRNPKKSEKSLKIHGNPKKI